MRQCWKKQKGHALPYGFGFASVTDKLPMADAVLGHFFLYLAEPKRCLVR